MSRKLPMLALTAVLLLTAIGFWSAWRRIQQGREFSRHWEAQTEEGTNYVVQLVEATLGRVENGCVLIVYARLRNPNPFALELRREGFVLEASNQRRYLPSVAGTQTELIKLGPGAVSEHEAFSFGLPEDSLRGGIRMQVGKDCWAVVKADRPYESPLRKGQFRTFVRREW